MDELVEKIDGYFGVEIVRICEIVKLGVMRCEIVVEVLLKVIGIGDIVNDFVLFGEVKWIVELEGKYCCVDFEDVIKGVKKGIMKEMFMVYEEFVRRDD